MTKKTEEVVETQKIKSQIRVEERNKERDLQHLGKLVYDRFQKGEVIDTVFVELCEAVAQHEDAVQSYLKELAQLKGMELCKNCKGELESDMVRGLKGSLGRKYRLHCSSFARADRYWCDETARDLSTLA